MTLKSKLLSIHSLLNKTGTFSVPKGLGNVFVGGVVFNKFAMILINKRVTVASPAYFEVSIWTDDPTLVPFIMVALLLLSALFD